MTLSRIPFGAAGATSVPSGFKRTNGPGSVVGFDFERAVGRDENGDESGSALHSKKYVFQETFEAVKGGSFVMPLALGVLDSLYTITGIDLETGLMLAKLTLHYAYFTASDVAPARKYSLEAAGTPADAVWAGQTAKIGSLAGMLGTGFGGVDFLAGTTSITRLSKVQSGKISFSCEVEMGKDEAGVYVQHEVHSGSCTADTSWMGQPDANAAAGWDVVSAKPDRANTTFFKWDVSAKRAFTSVAVA